MKIEYIICLFEGNSISFYNGKNYSEEDITNEHFSCIEEVFTFDTKEEALIYIEKALKNCYGVLSIQEIYKEKC